MDRLRTSGPVAIAAILGLLGGGPTLLAQDPPESPPTAMRIQSIARERRPEMEAAARGFLVTIGPGRMIAPRGADLPRWPVLDELKASNLDAYWMEVAQLAVQFQMFQNVVRRDTTRARAMAIMFGTEFEARIIQRAWKSAGEADRQRMRSQLETLMARHFDVEDQLRTLEMRDIEHRLADARAESERRRQRRAELVRWSVDDIIHGAERPD
jgi:hypothetical protein